MSDEYANPAPTECPTCGNLSVYSKLDRADGDWVTVAWCNVCQKAVP